MKTIATTLALSLFTASALAAPFKLTSKDFKDGGAIPDKNAFNSFGCTGENVSPELEWSNPPAGTKSFALLVHDPDAPTGGAGFWHWIVYNMPADTTSIPAGGPLPKGATQGTTDFGSPGWGGPCPPVGSGNHHYNFTVYALKVDKLDLPANATAAFVGFNVNANAIGKAKLTGIYSRKK
jgi:Raf kinase inhibitor-like YbhB/YbcL family protein